MAASILVQQVSGAPHKGFAPLVLLLAGAFADQHQRSLRIALPQHLLDTALTQRARRAVGNLDSKLGPMKVRMKNLLTGMAR